MLKLINVSKSFGDKKVLDKLNLNVREFSVFGFVGKNGAGKTTTMKLILGLLKADEGEILVNQENVVYGDTKTNKYIGYLPDVPTFYSFMTAREYLAFCGEITGLDKSELKSRIEELLQLVGLEKEISRIKGYSRGMKQRLGIAQALLGRPKLLICDEPTSALDPIGRREILRILKAISSETTVLFSTHILSDIDNICTDVAFINDGKIIVSGNINDIKLKYRKDEYVFEVEENASLLKERFNMRFIDVNKLLFVESDYTVHDCLNFISENKINIVRFEKVEPNLESLFMEVIK